MTVADLMYNRLRLDATLTGTLSGGQYSGILKGGVWNRPLKREGASHTPEAFYQSEFGKLNRPAAVVVDGGIVPHRQVESIAHAYWSFPRIVLYAPATASGKQALHDAFSRIYDLLHEWRVTTDESTIATFMFADRTTLLDSEEFIGAVSTVVRFQVTARYRAGE